MSGRSKEQEEELFKQESQTRYRSSEGVGSPLCKPGTVEVKAVLLMGPWLPVVRFGAGHFPSLSVSFLISKIKMMVVL